MQARGVPSKEPQLWLDAYRWHCDHVRPTNRWPRKVRRASGIRVSVVTIPRPPRSEYPAGLAGRAMRVWCTTAAPWFGNWGLRTSSSTAVEPWFPSPRSGQDENAFPSARSLRGECKRCPGMFRKGCHGTGHKHAKGTGTRLCPTR